MPLKKEDAARIKKNYKTIIESLKIESILDQMIQEGVFELDDTDKINSKATQKDRNREFVSLLIRSHQKGYQVFIECLKEDDVYADIAQQIESTKVEIIKDERIGRYIIYEKTNLSIFKNVSLVRCVKYIKVYRETFSETSACAFIWPN